MRLDTHTYCFGRIPMKAFMRNTLDVPETWPPRPRDVRNTHSCRAAGFRPVEYDLCNSITTSAGRSRHCTGCTCSWRICTACSLQRVTAPDIRSIDSATGLCAYHTTFGAACVRPDEETLLHLARKDFAAITASDIPALPKEAPILLPVSPSGEQGEEVIDAYCEVVRNRFTSYRLLILQYLAQGKNRDQMAALDRKST